MSVHFSYLTTLFFLLLIGAAMAVLWIVDTRRLRSAAKSIDASFQKLAREPQWQPLLTPQTFGDNTIARLDNWDSLCSQLLKFVPLTRLQEGYADSEVLGVRTVLISDDHTIVGTFACSHKDPRIFFRSFISVVGEKVLMTTDAKSLSNRPQNYIVGMFDKQADEVDMVKKLMELRQSISGTIKRFDTVETYVSVQQTMWRESNLIRMKDQYVVSIEALRKLAPANLSESRLKRIHRYIAELHETAKR